MGPPVIVGVVEYQRGRLIDHIHVRVLDFERSQRFYEAVLGCFGLELQKGEGYCWSDELFVSGDGPPTANLHLAFAADGEETVRRFHEAAIEAGGEDNGPPAERKYHPGYYAAYVLDPDGNNVEAVYHGPVLQSVPSVVIRPLER